LEAKHQILKHSKESEAKKYLNSKNEHEKKVKSLQNKIIALEDEVRAKEKENRLQAIKLKEVMRQLHDEQRNFDLVVKESRGSSRMRSGRMDSRGADNMVIKYDSEKKTSRMKSIEPFSYDGTKPRRRNIRVRNYFYSIFYHYRLILY
jgi:myosin heavy subunit